MSRNSATRWVLIFIIALTLLTTTKQHGLAERSLVRAVLLERSAGCYTVGILYQDVTGAADASEAGEQLKLVAAKAATPEEAFYAAELLLSQTADYKLCDYVLLCGQPDAVLLQQYLELLLAKNTHGRLAAYLYTIDQSIAYLEQQAKDKASLLFEWMDTLQNNRSVCPRVYRAAADAILIPHLSTEDIEVPAHSNGAWLLSKEGCTQNLDENSAQLLYLLQQYGGERKFLLQGREVKLSAKTVSVQVASTGTVEYTVYASTDSTLDPSGLQMHLTVLARDLMSICSNDLIEILEVSGFSRMEGNAQTNAVTVYFHIVEP